MAESTLATDIFERFTADPADASFTKIAIGGKFEWIKLKPGMEKAAAFLETHRYAAYVGGSLGFTKMEGTTVNIQDKVAYSALSACRDSMVAGNAKGNVPGNGIGIPAALSAGAVMALDLTGGLKDDQGGAIKSDWMPSQHPGPGRSAKTSPRPTPWATRPTRKPLPTPTTSSTRKKCARSSSAKTAACTSTTSCGPTTSIPGRCHA